MANKNPFADLFGSFGLDQAIAASRLNAKAFSDATKAAAEGAQALSRRQAEIFQNAAEEASNFWKEAGTPEKNPEANVAKQTEFAKKSIESAIANSKELLEMANKSNTEAGEIISKRVSAALNEFSANSNKKKKTEAA